MNLISIVFFGVVGILARFLIDTWFSKRFGEIPVGTLFINTVGSFLAGIFFVIGPEKMQLSEPIRAGLLVGFTGGFTTFSAYTLQSLMLWEWGRTGISIGYVAAAPLLGLFACYTGIILARALA